MRFANPVFVKDLLSRVEKAVATYKQEEFQNDFERRNFGRVLSENDAHNLSEALRMEDIKEDLISIDRDYYLGRKDYIPEKEDEIENLIAWLKEEEQMRKTYPDTYASMPDGDHVYPLPMQLF
jgi:hypothetical protein